MVGVNQMTFRDLIKCCNFTEDSPESILRLLLLLRDSNEAISTENLDLNCERRSTIVSGSDLNLFSVQEGGRGKRNSSCIEQDQQGYLAY